MRYWINLVLIAVVFTAGCNPPRVEDPGILCAGKPSVLEAVQTLELQRASIHPIRASVDVTLKWTQDGKEKKERLNAQLRYVPEDRLFLRGDKFGEIRFGTNEDAFWLMIKPEADSYWWGTRRGGERCAASMRFDPWHVAEALGAVQVDAGWGLAHEGGSDILTQTNTFGRVAKRIWVRACDYLIERIEMYPPDGNEIIRILLDDYVRTEQGYAVATDIQIEHYRDTEVLGVMRLELSGVRYFETDPRRMERLFARPSSENYENVYRLTEDCDFIEEQP